MPRLLPGPAVCKGPGTVRMRVPSCPPLPFCRAWQRASGWLSVPALALSVDKGVRAEGWADLELWATFQYLEKSGHCTASPSLLPAFCTPLPLFCPSL